jgi:hypothetical protein
MNSVLVYKLLQVKLDGSQYVFNKTLIDNLLFTFPHMQNSNTLSGSHMENVCFRSLKMQTYYSIQSHV